jgi:hypothetical protein
MRYVRIEGNAVAEAGNFDRIEGRFHPALIWIASETAEIGDVWDGAEFGKPVPPPPVVPQSVTMRQARLALLGAGKLALVQPAIDALPEPLRSAANIEWEFSGEVQRHKPLVLTLGPALGLSAADLDALFVTADAL